MVILASVSVTPRAGDPTTAPVASVDLGGGKMGQAVIPFIGVNAALDGAGAVASGVQRITLASDDPAVVALGTIGSSPPTLPGASTGIMGLLRWIGSLLGGTLTIGGAVSVTNLPATQPVSGSVAVSNLPSTQAVTGTFWQATQPVSLASTPGLTDTQLRASAVPVSLATAPALVASSAVIGKVGIDQTTPGTTNKVSIGTDGTVALNAALPAGTNTIGGTVRVPSATQAMPSRARIASAASTNATSVKASAGGVYHIVAANMATSARFLKLYDKASAPTVGTDTPIATIYLPANGGFAELFDIPMGFTTGIAYAITALVADTDTTAVALNDIHGFILYA